VNMFFIASKALLFLSSGLIIHAIFEQQDIRKMGGLFFFLPLSYCFFLISSLSLCGFPFFSGFFSKDAVLSFLFSANFFESNLCYHVCCCSAGLTAFYCVGKIIKVVFFI